MSAKGGRTFSLRVLLRANFVFLFSKFSSVRSSLHTAPLCCSFSFSVFSFSFFFFFNGFVCSPLGFSCACFHGGFGHREDALFVGTHTQSCLFGYFGVLLVDTYIDVPRVGMNNGAAPWCSDRGHALVSASVVVRRGVGAWSRAFYFPGFLSSTCERVASHTCPEDRRGRADH